MIAWFLPRLLGLGSWLKDAARYLLAHPMTLAAIVFAILWRVEAHEHATCTTARQSAINALHDAVARAQQAKELAERISKEKADAADRSHAAISDAGRVALAGYLATHRLQPTRPATAPGSQGDGAGVLADAPAVPIVAVPEQDMSACDLTYTYALSAYQWAQQFKGQ